MLSALVLIFAMSHAFRTVAAIMAEQLQDGDLELSKGALGIFAGSFHLAFAMVQPVVGVSLDRWGPRRTILPAFALALVGSVVSATAPHFAILIMGQVLIGIGCAPALLAAMVFITRRYPADDFARVSGLVLGLGGLGTLITATPLAWVIDYASWRTAFGVLGVVSLLCWLAVFVLVDDDEPMRAEEVESLSDTIRQMGAMVRYRHSIGILCLAGITYASFLALRGLWLGPLLTQRHDFSTVAVGNVALVVSLISVLGPIAFGYLDPGGGRRRGVIAGFTVLFAAMFAILGIGGSAGVDVALMIAIGAVSGYIMLQYADLRTAFPPEQVGRALSMFTMAMFSGVAAMQWLTSVVASDRADPAGVAMFFIAALLAGGATIFWFAPWPPTLGKTSDNQNTAQLSGAPVVDDIATP